jgi:diguanylate cyclase (GGDEF)-like protein
VFFAALILGAHRLAETYEGLVLYLPYIFLVTGLLLGWRFNQSRVVFAVLVLFLAEWFLYRFAYKGGDGRVTSEAIARLVAILLPLNLAVFSVLPERGLMNRFGFIRFLSILVQPLMVTGWIMIWPEGLNRLSGLVLVPSEAWQAQMALPDLAVAAFVAGFTITLFDYMHNRHPLQSGFYWVLACCLYALWVQPPGPHTALLLSLGALVVILAAVEASHSMAFRDELTSLLGRRALNEALLGQGVRYAVAMVDVDYFKKFNDRYGHKAGDQALKMVAVHLSRVKGGGKAYRYGGEEFTVLFPGKTAGQALPFLEELRQDIAEAGFVIRSSQRAQNRPRKGRPKPQGSDRRVKITVSIGLAECSDKYPESDDVLKAADKALYKAKRAGRNRVMS